MSALRNALQSVTALDVANSAAIDPRLFLDIDPLSVYGLNQQLLFQDPKSRDWAEKAMVAIRDAGIANDFDELSLEAEAMGLTFTPQERCEFIDFAEAIRKRGGCGQMALERVRAEDGLGVPAIAALVVAVVVAVVVWVVVANNPHVGPA